MIRDQRPNDSDVIELRVLFFIFRKRAETKSKYVTTDRTANVISARCAVPRVPTDDGRESYELLTMVSTCVLQVTPKAVWTKERSWTWSPSRTWCVTLVCAKWVPIIIRNVTRTISPDTRYGNTVVDAVARALCGSRTITARTRWRSAMCCGPQ